jgi:hypothetical protein
MATAFFAPAAPASAESTSTGLAGLAKRFVNALVAARARSAELHLRRHEAFVRDLGGRQDHSPLFLSQDDLLPFKI